MNKFLSLIIMAALGGIALYFHFTGNGFFLDLATRLTILAIAAVSLNLVLGYGGLISFGHAAYLGLGAYAVGIPAHHWLYGGLESWGLATLSGAIQFPLAIGVCALFALITGLICLRTKGVYFIMITMAFSQMVYYGFVSLEIYGGDDGLVIDMRSSLPFINLDRPIELFMLAYFSLIAAMILVKLIVNSRFGRVLQGAKGNNERVVMMGLNPYVFRLIAYVISGAMTGYAGALLGNFTTFISPEMMDWTRSGELMFMVILGGVATTAGPVIGASLFIILEELLSSFTIYWHLPFGLLLIAIVLFGKGGVVGLLKRDKREAR